MYRRVRATGHFAKHRLNLRFALECIVERVSEVPVTATSVIRAARAVSRIDETSEWVDPPARVFVTYVNSEEAATPEPPSTKAARAEPRIRPAPIFDHTLLDEPSDPAQAAGEMPKLPGDSPKEIVLALDPELQNLRIARWEAIQADRRAKAEANPASLEQAKKTIEEQAYRQQCQTATAGPGRATP